MHVLDAFQDATQLHLEPQIETPLVVETGVGRRRKDLAHREVSRKQRLQALSLSGRRKHEVPRSREQQRRNVLQRHGCAGGQLPIDFCRTVDEQGTWNGAWSCTTSTSPPPDVSVTTRPSPSELSELYKDAVRTNVLLEIELEQLRTALHTHATPTSSRLSRETKPYFSQVG